MARGRASNSGESAPFPPRAQGHCASRGNGDLTTPALPAGLRRRKIPSMAFSRSPQGTIRISNVRFLCRKILVACRFLGLFWALLRFRRTTGLSARGFSGPNAPIFGRLDSKAYLLMLDAKHADPDVIPNTNSLVFTKACYEQGVLIIPALSFAVAASTACTKQIDRQGASESNRKRQGEPTQEQPAWPGRSGRSTKKWKGAFSKLPGRCVHRSPPC